MILCLKPCALGWSWQTRNGRRARQIRKMWAPYFPSEVPLRDSLEQQVLSPLWKADRSQGFSSPKVEHNSTIFAYNIRGPQIENSCHSMYFLQKLPSEIVRLSTVIHWRLGPRPPALLKRGKSHTFGFGEANLSCQVIRILEPWRDHEDPWRIHEYHLVWLTYPTDKETEAPD